MPELSGKAKAIMNKAGMIAAGIGIVAVVIAGGDVDSALDTIGKIAGFAGVGLVLLRELFG